MSDTPSRSQQIVKVMGMIQAVMREVPDAERAMLEEAGQIVVRLDDDTPALPHNELSAEELRRRGAAPIRHLMLSPLDYIRQLFHGSPLLQPGDQWTISMGTDCGFAMEVTVRVKAAGDCGPPEEFLKGTPSAAATNPSTPAAVREEVPPPSDEFNTLLQNLGLRSAPKKPRRSRKKTVKDEAPDAG